MRLIVLALFLSTASAFAETPALKFDTEKLCQWQQTNNSMELAECTKLEDEAKAKLADLEAKADLKRQQDCILEANNFSIDSGFASYTLFTVCLKDGPGSL